MTKYASRIHKWVIKIEKLPRKHLLPLSICLFIFMVLCGFFLGWSFKIIRTVQFSMIEKQNKLDYQKRLNKLLSTSDNTLIFTSSPSGFIRK